MLDRKYIVQNAETVKQNCINRGVDCDVERLVELEAKRRDLLNVVQDLNRQANEVSKTIGKAKDQAERDARKEQGRKLREQKDQKQGEHDALDKKSSACKVASRICLIPQHQSAMMTSQTWSFARVNTKHLSSTFRLSTTSIWQRSLT